MVKVKLSESRSLSLLIDLFIADFLSVIADGALVRRVDYATGVESYFGFTALENESTALSRSSEGGSFSKNYIGVFLDKGLPEKNISPPSPDRRYKYIFEVVFRNFWRRERY